MCLIRNPVPVAGLLYDARAAEHNPTLDLKKKARSVGSGLARRTELIELGRVKVPVVMTHQDGVLLTEAVKVICHGAGLCYALTKRDQGRIGRVRKPKNSRPAGGPASWTGEKRKTLRRRSSRASERPPAKITGGHFSPLPTDVKTQEGATLLTKIHLFASSASLSCSLRRLPRGWTLCRNIRFSIATPTAATGAAAVAASLKAKP